MNAKAFVDQLAAKIAVEKSELELADRYLATAGLRQKASGRATPELTTKEALRLPLAIMAAQTPARVADDVVSVERFTPLAGGLSVKRGDYRAGLRRYGIDLDRIDFGALTLMDALDLIARHMARPWNGPADDDRFWLTVHRSGSAYLQFDCPVFEGDIQFVGALDAMPNDTRAFTRQSSISGAVIRWIGHVTKAAAA